MELFIYGDPRFLSGGEGGQCGRDLYERTPGVVSSAGCTTDWCEQKVPAEPKYNNLPGLVGEFGMCVHRGKSGYHPNVGHNRFLVDGQWPSAGIELETICAKCEGSFARNMVEDLKSNWFHFERDGSLDDGHGGEFGYELVTDPLPPRVYRDPRTWVGLENLIGPWLESFDHSCTGLHVHVGLNQFSNFDLPLTNPDTRMYIGKVMSMLVYFSIADASFVDRVCLRKPGRYCGTPNSRTLFEGTSKLASGSMTGYEFIDLAISKLVKQDFAGWAARVNDTCNRLDVAGYYPAFCQVNLENSTSHGVEVNTEHKYTIEFRRGKGTVHSLSIHRIVELMTMIVRYAGKCCRNPEEKVSSKAFYEFVHDNTTSEPLRKLVEKVTTAE